MSHRIVAVLEQLRNAFASETLPPPPPESSTTGAGQRGRGLVAMVFGVEQLPVAPERPREARRGLLSWLFAPDPLPFEPALPSRRRTRWLAWLFLPERIGGDTNRPEVH